MSAPTPKAILEPIPVGERIYIGDWWRDMHGSWNRRDSVGFFEKQKRQPRQAQHYRLVGLWSPIESGGTDSAN